MIEIVELDGGVTFAVRVIPRGSRDAIEGAYGEALKVAPFREVWWVDHAPGGVIRRLSPDANPIEISELPAVRDELTLLRAMGIEAAKSRELV